VGNPTEEDFAYLAGVIDGDGCISAMIRKDNGKLRGRIIISNTSSKLMKKLKRIFGACRIYSIDNPGRWGTKGMYHLIFERLWILEFGGRLLKYLTIERKRDNLVKILSEEIS